MTYLLRHRGDGREEFYLQPIRKLALGGDRWLSPRSGRFSSGKDLVPVVQESGWAVQPVWTAQKVSSHLYLIPETSSP